MSVIRCESSRSLLLGSLRSRCPAAMLLPGTEFVLTGLAKSLLKRVLRPGVEVDDPQLTCCVDVNIHKIALRVSHLHLYRKDQSVADLSPFACAPICSIVGWKHLEVGASAWPPSVYVNVNDSFLNLAQGFSALGAKVKRKKSPRPAKGEDEGDADEGGGLYRLIWTLTNPSLSVWLRTLIKPVLALIALRVTRCHCLVKRGPSTDQVVNVGRFVLPPLLLTSIAGKKIFKRLHGSELAMVKTSDKNYWAKSIRPIVNQRARGLTETMWSLVNLILFVSALFAVSYFYGTIAELQGKFYVFGALAASSTFVVSPLQARLESLNKRRKGKRSFQMSLEVEPASKEGIRVALRMPAGAMNLEQNGMLGSLQIRALFSELVVERHQAGGGATAGEGESPAPQPDERSLRLHAKIGAHGCHFAVDKAFRTKRGVDVGNAILDRLEVKADATLLPEGSMDIAVDCLLHSLALHSVGATGFPYNPSLGSIQLEAQKDAFKLALSFKTGFLFLGTNALAKILNFMHSPPPPVGSVSEESSASPERPQGDAVVAQRKKFHLAVECQDLDFNMGRTGSPKELYFGLCLGGNFEYYTEGAIRYLGIDRSCLHLKSKSLSAGAKTGFQQVEEFIIVPITFSCHARLGTKEGGLELSSFSVLLSFEELREFLAIYEDKEWVAAERPDGGDSEGEATRRSESSASLVQIEPHHSAGDGAADEMSMLGGFTSKLPLLKPKDGEICALRCQSDIHQVYFGVNLQSCSACVSQLPPLFTNNEVCTLFKVERLRGTRYFRLALFASDWTKFYVGKSDRNDHDISIRSLPSHSSSQFQFYTKRDKSTGKLFLVCRSQDSVLNLSKRGVFFFHRDCQTECALVAVDTSSLSRLPTFQFSLPDIRVHLLISKKGLDTSSEVESDAVLDQELCRLVLGVENLTITRGRTLAVYQCGLSLSARVRDSEKPSLANALAASRISLCYLTSATDGAQQETLASVFFWDEMSIHVNEVTIECLCIIVQGLSESAYFPVRHLKDLQSAVCAQFPPQASIQSGQIKNHQVAAKKVERKKTPAKVLAAGHTALTLGCYHFSKVTFKITSLIEKPACELLVGRLAGCSAETRLASEHLATLSDLKFKIRQFDIDTYHPNAESVVCLRTRTTMSKSLSVRAMSTEADKEAPFLNLDFTTSVRGGQKDISTHVSLSPIDLNVYEDVVFHVVAILLPYRKWSHSQEEREEEDKGKREEAAKRIQRWFRRSRKDQNRHNKLRRTKSAKKIQRWWRKKRGAETPTKRRESAPSHSQYHCKVLDIHPLQISAAYKSARSGTASRGEDDSVLRDFGRILDVLGAPEIGNVNIRCKRILLHDVDMSLKDVTRTLTQNLLMGVLVAVAEDNLEHNIPWLDGAIDTVKDAVTLHNPQGEEVERQTKAKRGNIFSRTLRFVSRTPKRVLIDPLVFICRAGAASVKMAGWSFLISAASDMANSGVKAAETSGLRGVYTALALSSVRMISTPPKQAVSRIWASRNALTSDLTATFRLSDAVGMNDDYLEAYVQGIVDHTFLVRNSVVSVKDNVLTVQHLPILESEREELVDYIESILESEGLLAGEEMAGAAGSKYASSSFSAKLRHLSGKKRDPKRELARIASSFAQNVAVVLVSQNMMTILPFHRLLKGALTRMRSKRRVVAIRTMLSTLFVFGYRRVSFLIPGAFAKKVCHNYFLTLAFQKPSQEETPVVGDQRETDPLDAKSEASQVAASPS